MARWNGFVTVSDGHAVWHMIVLWREVHPPLDEIPILFAHEYDFPFGPRVVCVAEHIPTRQRIVFSMELIAGGTTMRSKDRWISDRIGVKPGIVLDFARGDSLDSRT